MWFIGLLFDKAEGVNIDLTTDIAIFVETVLRTAHVANIFKDNMKIDTKHVKRKDLTKLSASRCAKIKSIK